MKYLKHFDQNIRDIEIYQGEFKPKTKVEDLKFAVGDIVKYYINKKIKYPSRNIPTGINITLHL